MRKLAAAVLATAALALAWPAAATDEAAVLTVTGDIAETNRGPFDPFRDALFAKLDTSFERAYAFSHADLRELPQHQQEISYPNWPGPVTVSGPKLIDVLETVGAEGGPVLVQALDGYAPSFARSEIDAGFVLALAMDGEPLALGGRGPIWLTLPPGSYPGQPAETDESLAWAVFHIRVGDGE